MDLTPHVPLILVDPIDTPYPGPAEIQQPKHGALKVDHPPYYPANVNLAVPAAANTIATYQIYNIYQTGMIRASSLVVSNLSSAAPSNIFFDLKNLVGETYLETVVQALSNPFAGVFWTMNDNYLPFREGLQLTITTGPQGTNTGIASLSLIWMR